MAKPARSMRTWVILPVLYVTILAVSWIGLRAVRWFDTVERPWGYTSPTLTGNWQGDAWAGHIRLRLLLSFSLHTKTRYDGSDIKGQAILCDSTGRVQSYPLWAVVTGRKGRTSEIHLSARDNIPGLRLDSLSGVTWDGGDELRAQAALVRVLANGSIMMSSADRPIPFLLHSVGSAQTCSVR
jgi:hypothetical protein